MPNSPNASMSARRKPILSAIAPMNVGRRYKTEEKQAATYPASTSVNPISRVKYRTRAMNMP